MHPSGDGVSEVFALFYNASYGGGASLITGRSSAWATDFLGEDAGKRVALKVGGALTEYHINNFWTTNCSPKYVFGKNGYLTWSPL